MRNRPVTSVAVAVLAASVCGTVLAQARLKASRLTIEPVVLDASESNGASLGLQWRVSDSILDRSLSRAQKRDDFGDVAGLAVRSFAVDYKLSGTVTAAAERNPKNFLDALLDAKFEYSSIKSGIAAAGGVFGKYESDQGLDNKQNVLGLRGTILRWGLIGSDDVIALDANYGQVDPSKDEARQTALGVSELDRYYRWDFEFWYNHPLRQKYLTAVEFNYRLFRETSAPAAVEQAGLNRHRLGTLRFALKNDLFVAYSRGKLPFDRQSDKIFEIGWSHNLKE